MLYEMVTGRVPFEAETPIAVILKHLQSPLPLPTTLKPDLHPVIEQVILKALAKTPDDRYPDVAAFLAAWKNALAFLSGEPPEVRLPREVAPASPPPAAPEAAAAVPLPTGEALPKKRRHWWRWAILAAALIIPVCCLALLAVNNATAPRRTATAVAQQTAGAATPQPDGGPARVTPAPAEAPSGWQSWTAANQVYTLLITQDGMVYAGGPGGITRWDPQTGEYLRITTADGLPDPHVYDLWMDQDGTMWGATDGGLARYDGAWRVFNTADGIDSDNVRVIFGGGDVLVVGTVYGPEGGGLNLLTEQGWQQMPNFPSSYDGTPGTLSNNVHTIAYDPFTETVWVATDHGLGQFDGQQWTVYGIEDGLPGEEVYSLLVDRLGRLLIGGYGGGVIFYQEAFTPLLPLRQSVRSPGGLDSLGRQFIIIFG